MIKNDILKASSLKAPDLLLSAGIRYSSYSYRGFGDELGVKISFQYDGQDFDLSGDQVEGWLKERDLYPTPTQVRLMLVEKELKSSLSRVIKSHDTEILSHRKMICSILTGDFRKLEPRLCYVAHGVMWFTTDMSTQWGDDWNDAPYEHNAGRPYSWSRRNFSTEEEEDDFRNRKEHPYMLFAFSYTGPFDEISNSHVNSPLSVQSINELGLPWLVSIENESIKAGSRLSKVRKKIKKAGGTMLLLCER